MGRLRVWVPLVLLAAALWAPAPAAAVDTPRAGTLYSDGPSGRYLLGGEWRFRLDKANQGLKQRFQRRTSLAGWSKTRAPSVWNLGDESNESMAGSIGWYRKDFRLPSARAALAWAVRFESVNYRSQVWLNGRPIGSNKGAYIPFALRLTGLKRRGTNRLVVRADSVRRVDDFPPAGLTNSGTPTGGWWNYGGLQREVYLERLDTVDFRSVVVRPRVTGSSATVDLRVDLRNVLPSARSVRVTGRFGTRRVTLGSRSIAAGGGARFAKRLRVPRPKLWSPQSPTLYPVSFQVSSGGRGVRSYRLKTGIRTIAVVGGRLTLNGQPMNVRGVGYHEDSKEQGFAVDNAFRRRLVAETQAIGATVLRTHYPPHPYLHELADRKGLLIWSEIPVYAIKTPFFSRPLVRRAAAKELRKNIETNQNHPSVMLWSIANELSAKPGSAQVDYIRSAVRLAKQLDPTRPVGLAVAAYLSAGCQRGYAPLDLVGINDYFGWYPGPSGQIFDRDRLSAYLDAVRRCYPDKALMITEFGAEANREGPAEEKGTWAFQQDFLNFHLGVYATKPWLSGALYWALNEFRIRPGWDGGNPRPSAAPIHQKGLTVYGTWARKPAWADAERDFRRTQQFGPPAGR